MKYMDEREIPFFAEYTSVTSGLREKIDACLKRINEHRKQIDEDQKELVGLWVKYHMASDSYSKQKKRIYGEEQ